MLSVRLSVFVNYLFRKLRFPSFKKSVNSLTGVTRKEKCLKIRPVNNQNFSETFNRQADFKCLQRASYGVHRAPRRKSEPFFMFHLNSFRSERWRKYFMNFSSLYCISELAYFSYKVFARKNVVHNTELACCSQVRDLSNAQLHRNTPRF